MLIKKGYRLTKRGKFVAFSFICVLLLIIFSSISNLIKTGTTEAAASGHETAKAPVQANKYSQANLIRKHQLSLYFNAGDSSLTVESRSALDFTIELAKVLDYNIIQIEGNCASLHIGNMDAKERKENITLSLNRANEVAKYLEKTGISKERLMIKGNGSDKSINSNSTYFERKLNRRVDIIFFKVK